MIECEIIEQGGRYIVQSTDIRHKRYGSYSRKDQAERKARHVMNSSRGCTDLVKQRWLAALKDHPAAKG